MPPAEEERSPPDGGPLPPPPVEATLPFWKNLVAGGGAGLVEIACMYPTDVSVSCLRVDVILFWFVWLLFHHLRVRSIFLFTAPCCCCWCRPL